MVIPNSEKVPEYRFRKRPAQTKTQKLNTQHSTTPLNTQQRPPRASLGCATEPQPASQHVFRLHRITKATQGDHAVARQTVPEKRSRATNHRGVCSLSSSTAPSCVSALQAPLNGHVADCGAACPHGPSYTCGHGATFCCRTPSPRLDAHSGTQTAEWRQCPGRTCCHHRRGVASRHAVHHHQP